MELLNSFSLSNFVLLSNLVLLMIVQVNKSMRNIKQYICLIFDKNKRKAVN